MEKKTAACIQHPERYDAQSKQAEYHMQEAYKWLQKDLKTRKQQAGMKTI